MGAANETKLAVAIFMEILGGRREEGGERAEEGEGGEEEGERGRKERGGGSDCEAIRGHIPSGDSPG